MFCDVKKVHFQKSQNDDFLTFEVLGEEGGGEGSIQLQTFSYFKGSICIFGFRTSLWTCYFEVLMVILVLLCFFVIFSPKF